MATKKKPTTKQTKSPAKKAAPKKTSKQAKKQSTPKKIQLPSPVTPALAVLSAGMTYLAFSLAIDSGSYWHYGAGFYFLYQAVRLTRISIKTRMNDKKRRAAKA